MKIGINILLGVVILSLTYILVDSIRLPIQFEAEWRLRESAVTERFNQIRIAQERFKEITGKYSNDFNEIQGVLNCEDLGILIDSLKYIPYTNKEKFEILEDTFSYQGISVCVYIFTASRKKYMGKYAGQRYRRYFSTKKPFKNIKFCQMSKLSPDEKPYLVNFCKNSPDLRW